MAKDYLYGSMEVDTTANLEPMISKEKAYIYGTMPGNLMVAGKIIKWMVRVLSSGQMVEYIQANTKTIKKKGMEFSNGRMAESIQANGRMVNKMEKVSLRHLAV